MRKESLIVVIKHILSGYSRLLKSLLSMLAVTAAAAAAGMIIVFPLWFFATKNPELYSAVILALFAASVLALAAGKIRSTVRSYRGSEPLLSGVLLPLLRKISFAVLALVLLYAVLLLYVNGMLLAGIASSVIYVLLFGYLLYAGKAVNRGNRPR